jgi:hypothetical protein
MTIPNSYKGTTMSANTPSKRLRRDKWDWAVVRVAGHSSGKKLFVNTNVNKCGPVRDGIAFRFTDQGCWVVPWADILAIVAEGRKARR